MSPTHERLVRNAGSQRYAGVIFTLAFGSLCLGYAAFEAYQVHFASFDYFMGAMGGLCFAFGLFLLQRTIRSSGPR